MDVARLNYSHGTLDEHAETVTRVRDAAGRAGRPVAILQDLPGPKLRIGPLRDERIELTPGASAHVRLRRRRVRRRRPPREPRPGPACPRPWRRARSSTSPTARCACASRRSRGEHEVDPEVEIGGTVASRQGLNIPGPVASLPAVPEEDLHLLDHGESIGVDVVALSFVQTARGRAISCANTRVCR